MIGLYKDIFNKTDIVPAFTNINYVDTAPAFSKARKNIEYIIPEFIKYISGNRAKSKVYGTIKRFYPEELIFMDKNIIDNGDHDIKNKDVVIEDSCSIYSDLRVVIINENFQLSSIAGYDMISFTKGDKHINTVFIQDKKADIPFTFILCMKLFDRIILNSLSELNIPIYANTISLLPNDIDTTSVAKFVVDYLYELMYPFHNSLSLDNKEVEALIENIFVSNYRIIDLSTLKDLFCLIKDTSRNMADDYDYIGFVMKVEEEIKLNVPNNIFV